MVVVVGGDSLLHKGEHAAALDRVHPRGLLICVHLRHLWIALRMSAA